MTFEDFKKQLDDATTEEVVKATYNEDNFEAVFDHWKGVIGPHIINGYKQSFYFLANFSPKKWSLTKIMTEWFSFLKTKIPKHKKS